MTTCNDANRNRDPKNPQATAPRLIVSIHVLSPFHRLSLPVANCLPFPIITRRAAIREKVGLEAISRQLSAVSKSARTRCLLRRSLIAPTTAPRTPPNTRIESVPNRNRTTTR